MIQQFGSDTALLLIDVQKGVHAFDYWGGPTGRMNNPGCQERIVSLLEAFRKAGNTIAFSRHDSLEPDSPLKLSLETGEQLEGLDILPGEITVRKNVNSAFIGTSLDAQLKRAGIKRLFANALGDAEHLTAVSAAARQVKGEKGPDKWQPPEREYACRYAKDWQAIKVRWGLTMTAPEIQALAMMLGSCG